MTIYVVQGEGVDTVWSEEAKAKARAEQLNNEYVYPHFSVIAKELDR